MGWGCDGESKPEKIPWRQNETREAFNRSTKMKNLTRVAIIAAVAMAPIKAISAEGNIPFSGSVQDTCIISVGNTGTLSVNTNHTVLGSEEAGGSAATATVLTTGEGYSLRADAPTAFQTTATTGNNNVSFEANYKASGASSIGKTDGKIASPLNRGSTSVDIDMSGTKTSGTFEAGSYDAIVLLRCE
jgi:hypothetical protein